ncbi:MAG: VCBS repeat-containing protein [Chloracidobacterium sp.]|nr:VCBS repeat-containing protein [Chloracidobacterium sp.]
MPTKHSSRVLFLTLILVVFATIAVNANWGSRIGHGSSVRPVSSNKASVGASTALPASGGTACTSNQRFTWPAIPEVAVGGPAMGVAMGDFNEDGFLDLVSTNDAPASSVSIRLGDGNGGFTSPPVPEIPVGAAPHPIAVGDFNGDGFLDFATANQGTANNVSIRLGNGNGGFTSPPVPEIAVGRGPTSMQIADFNNDGNLDIAVANLSDTSISVRLGSGDGGFVLPSVSEVDVGSRPFALAAGDLNNDGIPDLATSNDLADSVSIRIGNGKGEFTSANSEVAVGNIPMSIAIGDFNGDGNQDFVTTNLVSSTSQNGGDMSVRFGDGNGGFTSPAVPEVPMAGSDTVAVGDFNNDGKQDVITDLNYGSASIWLGDGSGNFATSTLLRVYLGTGSNRVGSIAVGDFNGDGIEDFAATTRPQSGPERPNISIRLGGCFPYTVDGAVLYGNAANGGTLPYRAVSYVLMRASGSQTTGTMNNWSYNLPGGYSLGVTGAGPFTVTPTKTSAVNNITSLDAARVAQHAADVASLANNQLLVADVSNNGSISSFDAGQIANFVVRASPSGRTGTWKFLPESRTYPSMTDSITGQDYVGLLFGEVSGNWADSSGRPVNRSIGGPIRNASVLIERVVSSAGKEVAVPVRVEGVANKGVIAYEFELRYDPSVIQPEGTGVDITKTVSGQFTAVSNAEEPGLLRVAVYGTMPITGNGILLNLRFTSVGASGTGSQLTWERFMFNEGEMAVSANNGQIELF